MRPQLPAVIAFVAFVLTSSFLCAQEWSRDQAVAEITQLATGQFPREQWPERNAKMLKWLERVEKARLDLGNYSFTKAIPHYFNRDYKRAGKELFASLSKQPKLPTNKFDTCLGRILMIYARSAIQDDNLDLARKVVPLALDRYSDRLMVYRVVAYTLKLDPSKKGTKYLNELLAGMLTDRELDDTQKQTLLASLYRTSRGRPASARARKRATTIKPFQAKSLDGQEIDLHKLVGKVVLVDFWATWCGPCIRKMPAVVEAHKDFKDQGLVVIGVSLDKEPGQKRGGELIEPDPQGETTKKIRATMKKLGMDWQVVYEGGGWETRLAKENGIRAIPATFLIDRKGRVRYSNLGDDELHKRIQELLGEGKQQQQRRY